MKKYKVLIAPNSFKECADSVEVTKLIQNSFTNLLSKPVIDRIEFVKKPISDGGDGFLKVCSDNLNLTTLSYNISTPFDSSMFTCQIGYSAALKKIFIESANVLGLKLILPSKRKPLQLSSKGMGELLLQIVDDVQKNKLDVEEVVIGIGGTGTNDLGLGLLKSFGMKLFDENKNALELLPESFNRAASMQWETPRLPFAITAIIDVDNTLLGESGASRVFAPQKGATKKDVEILEAGFENILSLLPQGTSTQFISGAGGGLAAGLNLFLGAVYKFSYDFVSTDLGVSSTEKYDLVITGEGSFDAQSLMNKGTMIVVNEFSNVNQPVFVIAGKVDGDLKLAENVKIIELSRFFSSPKESMEKIEEGIAFACKEIISQFNFY